MRRFCFFAAMAWLSATGPHANATPQSSVTELSDSIVVTANRFGLSPKSSIWPASALPRQTMVADQSLAQTLDGRFGLDVRQTSGVGSITTLSNWGAFNRHVLLLYNGRVVRDYSLGGFNLSDYSPDEFERIEVLKGPQSAFYGADAIGGVVNLISKNALADRIDLVTRYGDEDLRQYRADVSKLFGAVGVGGFAEFEKAGNNRPNAATERVLFGLRSDYMSRNGVHALTVSGRYFEDSLGVPGPLPDPSSIPVYGNREVSSLTDHQLDQNYSADLSYRVVPSANQELQFDLFWEKKNLDYHSLYNYQYSYFTPNGSDSALNTDSVDVHSRSIYNKRSAGASGRFQQRFTRFSISTGVDFLSGSLRATADDKSLGFTTVGPFAPYNYEYATYNFWSRRQDQVDFWGSTFIEASSRLVVDLSGRIQFVHQREMQPSYNLGAVLSLSEGIRAKIGYGYAFRLPSIADQFADEIYLKGNADLEPETSHSTVGTVEYEPSSELSLRLTGFSQKVRSLIQYQYDAALFRSVPHNINRFRSRGVDLSVSAHFLSDYYATLGMVYQEAEQTIDESTYVDAHYVPDIKWRFDWGGEMLPRFTVGFNLAYTSDRHIILYSGQTKTIRAVYEVGASIAYALSSQVRLSLTGYDLTDRRRPDQFGFESTDGDYPTPGRRLVAQLGIGLH